MTDIRISGEPELVQQILAAIKDNIPGVYSEKKFPSHRVEGEILIYLKVQEPNQIIRGNLQDFQVIELCKAWRSKSEVATYFGITFGAAEEILERLHNSGDLVRNLDDSGAKRTHHYEYLDARLATYCKDCASLTYRKMGPCCKLDGIIMDMDELERPGHCSRYKKILTQN